MPTETPWKAARKSAGKTLSDAEREIRDQLPSAYWLDRSKISRFENGMPSHVDPVVRAVLASFYGQSLTEIDPEADRDLVMVGAALRGRGSNSQPTGSRPALYLISGNTTKTDRCISNKVA